MDLLIDMMRGPVSSTTGTVEQVLKGMVVGLLKAAKGSDGQGDWVYVADPEEFEEVYGTTLDKMWWPLK